MESRLEEIFDELNRMRLNEISNDILKRTNEIKEYLKTKELENGR